MKPVRLADNRWHVPSETDPNKGYEVTVRRLPSGDIQIDDCTCPNRSFKKEFCKHMKRMAVELGTPMTALAPRPASIPSNAPAAMYALEIGKTMAASGFFKDAGGAAQAAVKIMAGMELGFGPFASMMGIQIVQGRPSLSAAMLAALIKKSKRYDFKPIRHDKQACKLEFYEWGQKVGESEFTMEDAKAAGLLAKPGPWHQYSKNMLFSRAISNGAKWYCSDITFGAEVADTAPEQEMPAWTVEESEPMAALPAPVRDGYIGSLEIPSMSDAEADAFGEQLADDDDPPFEPPADFDSSPSEPTPDELAEQWIVRLQELSTPKAVDLHWKGLGKSPLTLRQDVRRAATERMKAVGGVS